jgi:hypothetical protein
MLFKSPFNKPRLPGNVVSVIYSFEVGLIGIRDDFGNDMIDDLSMEITKGYRDGLGRRSSPQGNFVMRTTIFPFLILNSHPCGHECDAREREVVKSHNEGIIRCEHSIKVYR